MLAGEEVEPHPYVFCEDNYQIMMRSTTHKLVYYIGQEEGELYALEEDPHELFNRWDDLDYAETKTKLLVDLLAWLAGSTYWNAGYKRTRARHTRMRWPMPDSGGLPSPHSQVKVSGSARPAGSVAWAWKVASTPG